MNRNPMSNTGSPMFNIVQFIWAAAFLSLTNMAQFGTNIASYLGKIYPATKGFPIYLFFNSQVKDGHFLLRESTSKIAFVLK